MAVQTLETLTYEVMIAEDDARMTLEFAGPTGPLIRTTRSSAIHNRSGPSERGSNAPGSPGYCQPSLWMAHGPMAQAWLGRTP